jgi:threonine aldolase
MEKHFDLRSDTVTRPSPGMREAMAKAEVGDDVFGEDPTVNRLEETVAGLLGKEAALFVPSGTMGNQLCIKVQTQPGDEVIVEKDGHVLNYETGAMAFLSSVQVHAIPGRHGAFTVDDVRKAIRPPVYYMPRTSLVCIENTHNRAGGTIIPFELMADMSRFLRSSEIAFHLDGARLWNASAATGIPPKQYAALFDSVSVCFSKGLGAPIGSAIAGSKEFIGKARHYRKIFGGGMRQAGVLAAAALYALDHNVGRLPEDHEKARVLADELSKVNVFRIDPETIQTNIVIIDTERTGKTPAEVIAALRERGVLLTQGTYTGIRAVTHLDISMDEVRQAASVIREAMS